MVLQELTLSDAEAGSLLSAFASGRSIQDCVEVKNE
jgi:hypothetical protein